MVWLLCFVEIQALIYELSMLDVCTLHINVLSVLFVGGNGQNNGSKRLGCHRSNGYNMPCKWYSCYVEVSTNTTLKDTKPKIVHSVQCIYY